MTKARMARLSAFLNLLGAFLVFLSFQATSTNLLMIANKDKSFAFCIGDRSIFGLLPGGRGTYIGAGCPQGQDAKPAAVVSTDSPWLAKLGWIVLAIGFGLQIFSVEPSLLSKEDLRTLRKARKILER
jgi:hypothetical protein